MEPATRLLSLSFAMLIGCYVFGSIPLSVTLSEKSLRYTSITGAGLIVGTALSVIIPEGVHALYENKGPSHDHHHDHAHEPHSSNSAADKPKEKRDDTTAGASESSWIDLHQRLTTPPKLELHSMIGVSLTLGFVFMLIVDQLCGGAHSHNATNESSRHKSFTATLGLLVHAAADGVALGAAASSSRADVEMIVFVAIMLHKAPAAFGLSTFLLHEGFDRSRIRRHLLAFSLAAPLLAVITFYGLNQNEKEILSSYNATGLAMLFSAGTFLYVATVHILPELISRHQANNLDDKHGLTRREIVFLTAGILAPVFLGMYHKH